MLKPSASSPRLRSSRKSSQGSSRQQRIGGGVAESDFAACKRRSIRVVEATQKPETEKRRNDNDDTNPKPERDGSRESRSNGRGDKERPDERFRPVQSGHRLEWSDPERSAREVVCHGWGGNPTGVLNCGR